MEVMGKVLSARLDSTLKVWAAESLSPRYSMAVWSMASASFSQARARDRPTTPNRRFMASHAPSRSQLSSWGSTYMVDCLVYTLNLPWAWSRRRALAMSRSSKVRRFRPLSTSSPSFSRIISFISHRIPFQKSHYYIRFGYFCPARPYRRR